MLQTVLFLLFMIPGTIFLGLYDVSIKRIFKTAAPEGLLLGFDFLTVGLVLSVLTLIFGVPEIKEGFWLAVLVSGGINLVGQYAFYAAFKREDASVVSPLRLLTPIFVIATGFFVLGERPNVFGVAGILLTLLGLWFLSGSPRSFIRSSRELLRRPGVLFGLLGAFLFAVTFPFDKQGVVAGSATLYGGINFMLIGSVHFCFHLISRGTEDLRKLLVDHKWRLPLLLAVHSVGSALTFQALNFSLAVYAASVKRLWSLWAVLFSGVFLKEKDIFRKLMATIIMLSGIVITVVWG